MARIMNFNAGPAALPLAALERAREELIDFAGSGMSVMEHSHRGKEYEKVHDEAIALLRKLLGVGDSHEVLFLQGGASQMFAQLAMNLLEACRSQPWTKALLALTTPAIWRGVVGAGLTPIQWRIPADVRQRSGLLDPVPRGSKLTRLNRARSDAGNVPEAPSRYCTPDAPGPPGLKTMSPIGCGRLAASSTAKIGTCEPPGSEYETGTESVAHSNSPSQLCHDRVAAEAGPLTQYSPLGPQPDATASRTPAITMPENVLRIVTPPRACSPRRARSRGAPAGSGRARSCGAGSRCAPRMRARRRRTRSPTGAA